MLTGSEIRAGRALVRWRAVDLAAKAGVNLSTIQRAEKVDGPAPLMPANEKAIRSALEAVGVVFIPENGGGAGVRLKHPATAEQASGDE
ncbi:MAG: transcriptional regulator [Acetobacteraceae bacterium]|nr:MAG: transcriptional regulator [Acetobacteraceae bacterium]